MSIKERQLEKIRQDAVEEELRSGREPGYINVSSRINEKMSSIEIGRPVYKHKTVEPNERSDAEQMNAGLMTIKQDLETGFEEIMSQHDEIASIAKMYETERKGLQLSISKTMQKMAAIKKRTGKKRRQVIQGDFRSFDHIDLGGDETRGIERTDAFVDLVNMEATLKNISSGGTRQDISSATHRVRVVREKEETRDVITEEGSLRNTLSDSVNDVWRYSVKKKVAETAAIEVTFELAEKKRGTKLEVSLHSPKTTEVTCWISENGKWKEMKTFKDYEKVGWKFDMEVEAIRLVMRKEEPDIVDGVEMEYLFGISKVVLKKEVYAKKSTLTSSSFKVESKEIDAITLHVTDALMPGSKVAHYIGTDDGVNFVEWQEVRNGQTLHLHQLGKAESEFTKTSEGYGEKVDENFGIEFYKIGSTEEAAIQGKIEMYLGEYMWMVETKKVGEEIPEGFLPSYQDWQDLRGVETTFLPIEETYGTRSWLSKENSLQRFTTNVRCVEEENIYNVELVAEGALHQVYVNSSVVRPMTVQDGDSLRHYYNYKLRPGWNKIEVLLYTKEAGEFKPGLYLKDVATEVLGMSEPMKEISYYDLLNNTPKRSVDRFALEGKNIVTNQDPKGIDETGDGVRYRVKYKYVPQDARWIEAVRYMAVLSRDESSEHITPVIKSYELIIE